MFNPTKTPTMVKIDEQYDFIKDLRDTRELKAEIVKKALLRGEMDDVAYYVEEVVSLADQIKVACADLDALRIKNINEQG